MVTMTIQWIGRRTTRGRSSENFGYTCKEIEIEIVLVLEESWPFGRWPLKLGCICRLLHLFDALRVAVRHNGDTA